MRRYSNIRMHGNSNARMHRMRGSSTARMHQPAARAANDARSYGLRTVACAPISTKTNDAIAMTTPAPVRLSAKR